MRRFSHLISYAPAGLLAIALVSTAADWRYLVETGGWFALLGNFMMVAATLVLLFLAGVLALCLAALPFIYLFWRNEDDFFALAAASRAGQSPRALLAVMRRIMVRRLIAVANPIWKALWWSWWFIGGGALADTGRKES